MNLKKKSMIFVMAGALTLPTFSMTLSADTTSETDAVSSATTTTSTDTTTDTTTDSTSTVALLDRNNLTDGVYDFSVILWHATKDQASMAASVIESAKLIVSGGTYRVVLSTQEMTTMGVTATLDALEIKQSDGTYESATKSGTSFSFTLPSLDDYVDVKVEYLGHTQEARLKLGWTDSSSVDKTELTNLIASAQGLSEENYTTESYAALTTALAAAQEVANDESATSESVSEAVEQLQAAIQALESVSEGLADGVYTINVALWNATADQASMANAALLDTAKLVVENGEYRLYIYTQPMTFGTITASLQTLKYPDADGNYQLATVEAEEDGNPTQFSFPIYSQEEYILVKVNPEVALMGNQDIDARIKLDWSTLTLVDGDITIESTVAQTQSSSTSSSIIKNTAAQNHVVLGLAGLFTVVGTFLSLKRRKENA